MKIFMSVGRIATQEQKAFLERLESKLRNAGLDPRSIGRNTFTSHEPLERVKELMRECRGLIVVAFERTIIERGREARGLGKDPLEFRDRRYGTTWHQIELAMACMLNLPTFVVKEETVHEEGLLEDKYGWYVFRTVLRESVLDSDEFNGILADWTKRCGDMQPAIADGVELTIGQLLRGLKVSQLWAILVALAGLTGGAFAVGGWSSNLSSETSHSRNVTPAEGQQTQRSSPDVQVDPALDDPAEIINPLEVSVMIAVGNGSWKTVQAKGKMSVLPPTDGLVVRLHSCGWGTPDCKERQYPIFRGQQWKVAFEDPYPRIGLVLD